MNPAAEPRGPILVFPGQGSYSRDLLRELRDRGTEVEELFESADRHCRRMLGGSLSELLAAPSADEHDRVRESHPDLDQVGIFLGAALVARELMDRGVRPRALMGHSLGDLAALASAGVFSIDEGVRIVCHRVLALRTIGAGGRMAAVSASAQAIAEHLSQLDAPGVEIAVINNSRQTVLSGPAAALEALVEPLARARVSLTFLESRYPFHSSLLSGAVAPFEIALRGYELRPPETPVFLSTEGRRVAADDDLASLLARQFTRRLDFPALLRTAGARDDGFVECGDRGALVRILSKSLDRAAGDRLDFVDEERGGLSALAVRQIAAAASGPVAASADHSTAHSTESPVAEAPETSAPESCEGLPVAIVAMGCVLPGAGDPDTYWHNLLEGVSGIADLAELDPVGSADFLIESPPGEPRLVPDKTYTLLNGAIPEVPYQSLLAGWFEADEFGRLTKGQRLLAVALAQSLAEAPERRAVAPGKIRCILGATADGFAEYDEAMVLAAMRSRVDRLQIDADCKQRCSQRLGELLDRGAARTSALGQHACLQQVVDRMLPGGVRSFVVDTACSSSLYAINLGIKELARGSADLIYAGGVFAPGPANNTLFAQFRGLTPNGSRPLDAGADGVVFGDGAAIVVLQRLADAIDSGGRILGVIRGMGLASDGKSPSINVPRSRGQSLAMRRAYRSSGIEPRTIQYVEAHATATPVGDAVEFRSLCEVFGEAGSAGASNGRKIGLGSVKSLIGHTGWVSGAASLIKMLKAFEHGRLPPQHNYDKPQEGFRLEDSPFTIATEELPWPANIEGLPRRAGINGFGFGGTDAHLIVEEYEPAYHERLRAAASAATPKPLEVSVVALSSLFPDSRRLARPIPGSEEFFDRGRIGLPKGKILLPDVVEHMDPSQFLAAAAASEVFGRIGAALPELEGDIAVVLGLESKTERGVEATVRVFLDRLTRLLNEQAAGMPADEREAIESAIGLARDEIVPSGPYTLPGLMPNVTASRISSLFDLQAPNLVIDRGPGSMLEAVAVAGELLVAGDCRLALVGGINALGSAIRGHREGLLLLAVALPEVAEELELPMLFRIAVEEADQGKPAAGSRRLRAEPGRLCASGAAEIVEALRSAEQGREALVIEAEETGPRRSIRLAPATKVASGAEAEPAHAYDFVEGTPIYRMTPRLSPSPASSPPESLAGRRVLLLTDQEDWWRAAESAGVAAGAQWTVVSSSRSPVAGSTVVDLESEAAGELDELLSGRPFDVILAVKDLRGYAPERLLGEDPGGERLMLDLLFETLKRGYSRLQEVQPAVIGLCLDGFCGSEPHPYTGLFGGMLKSVARELPALLCRAVCIEGVSPEEALRAVELELGQSGGPVEVFHRDGARWAHRLEPVASLASGGAALGPDSVVLATGGGRGVTAVLAEELLERFGCTVIGLGRTDPEDLPPEMRAMEEDELASYEGEFYREQLAQGVKIIEAKRRYAGYQSAHELRRVIERFGSLRGRYEYRSVDIGSGAAIAALLEDIHESHGRLDLVVHGAGVQLSQQLSKKSLETFRRIVGTKLDGLAHIHRESARVFGAGKVAFHLLTSAFSYLGNDGQPDYGAANETMNRLAAVMGSAPERPAWSSIAWLGWAGVGMTRGSEFAALAARRRLRGVTEEEGRQIFAELMSGRPAAAVNVLLADGEIAFYEPDVADAADAARVAATSVHGAEPARRERRPLSMTLGEAPFLVDHQVRGVPTLPGAFIIGLAAEAAMALRPGLAVTSFQDTSFQRFVRVYPERDTNLHLDSEVLSETDEGCVVRVRLTSDFVHHTGALLRENVVQTEIFVHLAAVGKPQPEGSFPRVQANGGRRLPDPYVMEGSPVRLRGPFVAMSDVIVEKGLRTASFRLSKSVEGTNARPNRPNGSNGSNGASGYDYLLPTLIMVDAFWRFGTVQPVGRQALAVYVPERCRRMGVFFDYAERSCDWHHEPVVFLGANPRECGDQLRVGPIEARTESGRLLLTVEGGVCRRFGVINNAF